jgi:hypothetical protein
MPDSTDDITQTLDPELKALLSRVEHTLKAHWSEEAKEFKKEISSKPPPEEQQLFAFIPHQMAKTSIFFPMSDRDLQEDRRKISKIEHQTSWGSILIEGIKLSISEEDILFALLRLAKAAIEIIGGIPALATNMHKIIHALLYGRAGYSQSVYERIEQTLQHFQLVRFQLTTWEWKMQENKKVKVETVRSIGNIVQSYKYNKETKDIVIQFNPLFFAYFLESVLTNINYSIRRQLKKDGSKALLRFLSTHTNPSRMHIGTVLDAINYNTKQPMFRLRDQLKQFIRELKKHGVLGEKTKLFSDNTVSFDILHQKRRFQTTVQGLCELSTGYQISGDDLSD